MGYIYGLKNKLNNKYYIGQTTRTPEIRLDEHIQEKNRDRAKDRKLYVAINKFGIHSFDLITIEKCDDDKLNQKEKYYIEFYDAKNNGYNETYGGKGKPFVNKVIEQKIIETYQNNKMTVKLLSKRFNLCVDTVSEILKQNKITTVLIHHFRDFKIRVTDNCDINIIFQDSDECIDWLIKNKNLTTGRQRIKKGILATIDNKRKSYYSYKFFIES